MAEDVSKLVLRAQDGDKEAFGEVYKIFVKRIFRFIYFMVSDRHVADDLAQETFLKAWRKLDSFSEKRGGSFQAFLFAIARNNVIDFQRKRKNLPISLGFDIESDDDPSLLVSKNEDAANLREALAKLSIRDRHIIVLRYFEDLGFTEISKVLKMREGAVRVKLHRSLIKLKGKLEEKSDGN